MIELVSANRCIGCNICVQVCPTNVFDARQSGIPHIARQSDCQTCFMCEVYCPADALYVAPQVEPLVDISPDELERELVAKGLLGSYRQQVGWGRNQKSGAQQDATFRVLKAASLT
ncbi:MAG: ferredoxin family protein [Cyanobacteriota bacterium]|nr:ferredoxin family protein [Cyanobacteriota bacterium]